VERTDPRITIGYVCGEFREHATSILMCGVWEQHDKSRFRLIAFDNGGADGSDYRARIEAAFDEIVDISNLGDEAAADAIRERQVDVLLNLNGYYGRERTGVFAHRPSPIQVNYLGFPGTLGAGYFDYLIADQEVIPPAHQSLYVEKVVYLPDTYQANDDRRPIASRAGSRGDAGLPEGGFVFCCFNNRYKITPSTFDCWMRILDRVPGSVLWLLEDFLPASQRLRDEAVRRGIDPARLVFAQRQKPADHLARHQLADLFLDTLPYNAHTTASDALWAGLPVLTLKGPTFPGRVAASLLKAIGLPELVTHSAQEFEELAVALASDAPRLATLRNRLKANRSTHPLFDTKRFTRHLEQAFERMVSNQREGHSPGPFSVPEQ
jgi:protein O-GlcNAc transferase